ncbi:unnamed protein product [Paramecium sonneborni]|uniref:Transmembrane protein n=1 Tax=Paramecium sonneborni TaxID=65129 RepID=A0A8S1QE08_9CILI|nr:unnamed protein product [Paramecium sonneborni]
MFVNFYVSMLFVLFFKQVQNYCQFSTMRPILGTNSNKFSIDQTLPKELILGEMNVGFGVWMKYMPLAEIRELSNRASEDFSILNEQIVINGGQFIYSIDQSNEKFKIIVVSVDIDQNQQKISHKVFYSFKTQINTLLFEFDNYLYENQWIMFYCYFEITLGQTIFGFYNSQQVLPLQIVNDLPQFLDKIKHNVGNVYQYKDQEGKLIILSQFKGRLSSIFSAKQDNVFLDLQSCSQDFLSYVTCYNWSYEISTNNQEMNGDNYIKVNTQEFESFRYVIKGWIVLSQSMENYLETVIFRITINKDYSDDLQIGDRDIFLKYYQSIIPSENGFQISTYSYQFPIKKRYKTNEDDTIQQFGDEYSELLIKWHYFQYEIGTQNNNGQPQFQIYFPSINQVRIQTWSKPIRHFSGSKFYIFLGGDDYTQNYLKGFVSDINLQLLCKPYIDVYKPTCHYSCLSCDGPTKTNCLTCPEYSFRQLSKKEKTCACQQRYVDKDGVQECQSVIKAFPLIQIQEIELDCQLIGYSNCNQDLIECSFGYFQYKNICVQCPYYFDLYSSTKINCLDCFVSPKQFGQTLTCKMSAQTYQSNPEYLFQVQQRNENDYLFFNMLELVDEIQQLQLCQGCISQGVCKEGFYFKNNQCIPCIDGCRYCSNQYQCESCNLNYYLNKERLCILCEDCQQCYSYNDGSYQCNSCEGNSIILHNKCVSCGDNCQKCDGLQFCYYCKGSPSQYYLSIDGKNCIQCNIQNCIYCYDYILNGGIIQTTLDINFKVINQNIRQVNVGCALCKENYHYNQNTQKCELKEIADDCQFAIIQVQDFKKICIISKNDDNAVQVSNCTRIKNCISCIHNYTENDSFCIICEDGFYAGVLTGQCTQCGQICKTCIQQNQQYGDYWKWNIKAYYKHFINHNNDHSFENYASTNSESDLNLICTSCHYGYILYHQKCIKDCDSNCNKCEIIDGQATCIQCLETISGFIKSSNQDGLCIQCPSNCKACLDRSDQEIQQVNPYFILTDQNKFQTRICFEKSIYTNSQEKYHYDSLTQTIVVCNKFDKCYNKIMILQNLYCDGNDFYDLYLQSNDENFMVKNIPLFRFFQYDYLDILETPQLFDYLNDISVRHVQFEFTIIQGFNQGCEFSNNLEIFSTLAQKIFSLQQMDIKFKGKRIDSDNPIQLSIASQITISNYTIITFENINFDFGKNLNSQANYSIISMNNLKNKLTFRIIDCIFETKSTLKAGQFFKIVSNIPYSLQISNLLINNLYVYQSDIFTFNSISNITQNYLHITNITIKNSEFTNSTLFKFQAISNPLNYKSQLQKINISDTKFISSDFFLCKGLLDFTIGTLQLGQIYMNNVEILKNSNIFLLNNVESTIVSQLVLKDSQLRDNSSFFSSNVINLKDCIINQTLIESSMLIQNNIEYTKSQAALNQSQNILIKSLKIINSSYNNKQQILKIIKYDEINQLMFNLTNFEMSNCVSTNKMQNTQISFDQVMIYIECQICNLEEIYIQRGYGLPEMTILYAETLEIRNSLMTQDQRYFQKVLHSTIDCVQQLAIVELYFFLYVGQYQNILIDNLNVTSCLSFNTPLIIFQGYDLMQRFVEETIYIQNSFFISNLLIVATLNKNTALISLDSKQKGLITFQNTVFYDNHLNEYFQALSQSSSATLFLSLKYGTVRIQSCQFLQNLVTNSTNSILYIDSQKIILKNSQFQNNNIMNYSSLNRYILLKNTQDLTDINVQFIFPIKSTSGNGMLISKLIMIDNIKINSSISIFGGGFYIIAQGISFINIINSAFLNTRTTLSSLYFSKGGCFYIDASSSVLTLNIKNTTFDSIYSRSDGGAIYIIPSESSNLIVFEQLLVRDCFSMQNQFFSYTLSKKDSIKSQINFQNIDFYSTKEGIENFYSNLDSISDDEVSIIIHSNPLIFVQFGNFSFYNCTFQSIYIQFLMKIVEAQNILMSNIKIFNCSIAFSPLIQLNLKQQSFGKIQIFDIQISQVFQIQLSEKRECLPINSEFFTQLECPMKINIINTQITETKSDAKNIIQLICNQLKIFKNSPSNFSLIEINKINQKHILRVEQFQIQNVVCKKCQFGLVRIFDVEQLNVENIKFSQILIQNSKCGRAGCLFITKSINDFIIQNLPSNYRILQQHDYQTLINQMEYQVIIENSLFLNNSASFGGSLLIVKMNTIIISSIFQNNFGNIGGAIYYQSEDEQLYILDSKIIENTADIAGGIYLSSQQLQLTKQLDLQLKYNNATLYGSNVLEKPRSLTLSIDSGLTLLNKIELNNSDIEIVEQILIIPYKILGSSSKMSQLILPSGIMIGNYRYFDPVNSKFIPYNLTLRIIALDKFQKQIKGLTGSYCNLQPIAFNLSSQREVKNIEYSFSYNDVIFNETSGDYNLDNLIIYFNPTYNSDIVLRLQIECNSISVPQYKQNPPFQIQKYTKNYKLQVDIRTFPCQLGEFLNHTSGGCVLCNSFQNQYQVSYEAQNCSYKDDTKIKSLESSMIELRQHYWRAYYFSQTIEYCYHLVENCKGGWRPGDESCILGHIGALCEQCDLYNSRGSGSYSVSSTYSCGSCDQIVYNVITIIFVSLWTLISTLMSVSSTIEMIDEFVLGLRLKAFGVRVAIKEASTAILIKLFTNYLQIISTISTFQLQVPVGLASIVNSAGNPIESLAYSLDCFLVTITDILIIYFRIIWSLIMTSSYITIIFTLGAIAVFTKQIKFNFSFISTSLIYLFIYLQPNLIGGIISLLSYRQISDQFWIQGNVAYRYDTIQHAQWIITFCLPLLFTFGCILPFFLWFGVHKNKHHLDFSYVRKTWGYLYNEYQLHAYFWETLKILQKEIIIIVLAYYDDHVPIKASLVFLVLFSYTFITIKQKPYMTGQLNKIDTQSTVVCAVSIILASSIYTAQQQQFYEIVWPFYIIIAFLNAFYILNMLSQILFAYFKKLHEKIDTFKEFILKYFPSFFKSHPCLHRFFETHQIQQSRIKKRFAKLREYLVPQARQVLEFKKKKGLELSSKNFIFKNNNQEKQFTDPQFSAEIFSVNNLMNQNILQQSHSKKDEYSFPNNKIEQHSFAIHSQRDNLKQNQKLALENEIGKKSIN